MDVDQPFSQGQRMALFGLSLLMLGLGVAYFVAPERIEEAYGAAVPERGRYAMHYAVGTRDLFYGLLVLTLTWLEQRQAVLIAVGLGVLLPLGDAAIVLLHERAGLLAALPHLGGVVMLLAVFFYVRS